MWRFAATITAIEILLTGVCAVLLTMEVEPDPFLGPDDLRSLGLPFEAHETQRRVRFDALHGYDSNVVLLRPRQQAWIAVRIDQTPSDYGTRRRREENWASKAAPGLTTVADDPGRLDEGYLVRHRSGSNVRCELVRFRGDRMLVTRVSMKGGPADVDEALAACERRARLLQARMLTKLRWSELRAGRR